MPHSYNRAAFDDARSSTNVLLSLYGSLVKIELALKDRLNPWKGGHRLAEWLTDEADPGLTSLTVQLATGFGTLTGTDRNGQSSQLQLDSYPEIRYLRHEIDYPGGSTEMQLMACLLLVRDIENILRTKGIL